MKIGVIREYKNPPDFRVPLTPEACVKLLNEQAGIELFIERSPQRSYANNEYTELGLNLVDDVSHCDILIGVKEVPVEKLIPNKTYLFFSHTHKKQAYNRHLLAAILDKNIHMVDYECLRYEKGNRIIGFGRYAGIVGVHNGFQTYGRKTETFELPAAYDFKDFAEIKEFYKGMELPNFKTLITGEGKVAWGSKETADAMGIRQVSANDYLTKDFDEPVYAHLMYSDFYQRKTDGGFDKGEFYTNPELYECPFEKYWQQTDLFINGIYWDNKNPVYFTQEDMRRDDFRIKVISDVTCDIAPDSSIPSTLKATKIGDPVFGYDPINECEVEAYTDGCIDMMTIDNLPNELPRDASADFSEKMVETIIPELLKEESAIIKSASLTKNGKLTEVFSYLQDFVEGRE